MSTLQTTELLIDPKDLQIRTVTVEKLLEPLITQVTTLINCPRNPSNKKKGCSKRAQVLLRSVEDATLHLVEKGEKIAKDSNLLKDELMAAVEEVWKESCSLSKTASVFTDNPCHLPAREDVVQAARALLAAVTRLLILADVVDVIVLLQHLKKVQRTFEVMRVASSHPELRKTYQKFRSELELLDKLAQRRQLDLKSPEQRDEMAGARSLLKQSSVLLYSNLCACLEHPDIASLQTGKDLICGELQSALSTISSTAQCNDHVNQASRDPGATLGGALDELESAIIIDPWSVKEETIRPALEQRLEAIISGAALLADSSCTRDFHRERIITECNTVRQALQELLSEYVSNAGLRERSDALNEAIENMCKKTRDLRKQLRKAIIDHVSDAFLDTTVPLLVLMEAAKNGKEKEIKEYVAIFKEHANKLVEGGTTSLRKGESLKLDRKRPTQTSKEETEDRTCEQWRGNRT
ncbi:catenin alpha-3-like isoform X3 [Polypterus senegalus]|uniref:catenin alpha-3-like isoform X3 n=1 Tax=Polypterus senegalus TaxID=55291 RepID=UPI0019669D77|nr:catenin alpha-3-like isoform X3 [Polypterus senegalus]